MNKCVKLAHADLSQPAASQMLAWEHAREDAVTLVKNKLLEAANVGSRNPSTLHVVCNIDDIVRALLLKCCAEPPAAQQEESGQPAADAADHAPSSNQGQKAAKRQKGSAEADDASDGADGGGEAGCAFAVGELCEALYKANGWAAAVVVARDGPSGRVVRYEHEEPPAAGRWYRLGSKEESLGNIAKLHGLPLHAVKRRNPVLLEQLAGARGATLMPWTMVRLPDVHYAQAGQTLRDVQRLYALRMPRETDGMLEVRNGDDDAAKELAMLLEWNVASPLSTGDATDEPLKLGELVVLPPHPPSRLRRPPPPQLREWIEVHVLSCSGEDSEHPIALLDSDEEGEAGMGEERQGNAGSSSSTSQGAAAGSGCSSGEWVEARVAQCLSDGRLLLELNHTPNGMSSVSILANDTYGGRWRRAGQPTQPQHMDELVLQPEDEIFVEVAHDVGGRCWEPAKVRTVRADGSGFTACVNASEQDVNEYLLEEEGSEWVLPAPTHRKVHLAERVKFGFQGRAQELFLRPRPPTAAPSSFAPKEPVDILSKGVWEAGTVRSVLDPSLCAGALYEVAALGEAAEIVQLGGDALRPQWRLLPGCGEGGYSGATFIQQPQEEEDEEEEGMEDMEASEEARAAEAAAVAAQLNVCTMLVPWEGTAESGWDEGPDDSTAEDLEDWLPELALPMLLGPPGGEAAGASAGAASASSDAAGTGAVAAAANASDALVSSEYFHFLSIDELAKRPSHVLRDVEDLLVGSFARAKPGGGASVAERASQAESNKYAKWLIKYLLIGSVKEELENHARDAAETDCVNLNAQSPCATCNTLHVALMLRRRRVIAVACVVLVNGKAPSSSRGSKRRMGQAVPSSQSSPVSATVVYAMTHEEHRGQGVMRRLVYSLMKTCCVEKRVAVLTVLSATPADIENDEGEPWNWWMAKAGPNPQHLYFSSAVVCRKPEELLALTKEHGCEWTFFCPWKVEPKGLNVLALDQKALRVALAMGQPRPAAALHGQHGDGGGGGGTRPSSSQQAAAPRRSPVSPSWKLSGQAGAYRYSPRTPHFGEYFCGKAPLATAFHQFRWEVTINDDLSDVKLGGPPAAFRELVTFHQCPFEKLWEDQTPLFDPSVLTDVDWFGLDCSTYTGCARGHHRTRDEVGQHGQTDKAIAANHTRWCVIKTIETKSKLRPEAYWFAIENPDTSILWELDEIVELKREMRAAEIRFDQCPFGKECRKRTRVLTNIPPLIYHFGTEDKEFYPDAPDPQFLCGQEILLAKDDRYAVDMRGNGTGWRHLCPNAGKHPRISDDIPSHETAPYPVPLAYTIATLVNFWWRSPKVGFSGGGDAAEDGEA